MSCFNLQKTTSKGSSRVTFPTLFQQCVSLSPPGKLTAWGERKRSPAHSHQQSLTFLLTVSTRCPFWQLQWQNGFVIGTHVQAEIIHAFHLSCRAAIRKLVLFSCSNSCSGFELVAFWWQALISYHPLPSHPTPLNTCTLKNQWHKNVNDSEVPSDRDVTFTWVGWIVWDSMNWRWGDTYSFVVLAISETDSSPRPLLPFASLHLHPAHRQ